MFGFDVPSPPVGDSPEAIEQRNRNFAAMFKQGERVWLASETYDPQSNAWWVDLVRQLEQGRWMCQRFKYDVLTGVIFFFGIRPVSDEELATLRREARPFRFSKVR